jgi:hypothetical protein
MAAPGSISFAEYMTRSAVSVIEDEQKEYIFYAPAMAAIRNRTDAPKQRLTAIEDFFVLFKVHRPHSREKRAELAKAVIEWADRQDVNALITFEQMPAALLELEQVCRLAYGGPRRFTSLASKVLWLRFPDNVPIYDRYAVAALQVLAKLESGIAAHVYPGAGVDEEYSAFLHYWRGIYSRYEELLTEPLRRVAEPRPHKVKIFDRILWNLGNPTYE